MPPVSQDEIWAYQGILLAETAKMRGLGQPLFLIAPGPGHVYVTGIPLTPGHIDVDRSLTPEEALLAAMLGLALQGNPSVLARGGRVSLGSVSPQDAADAIVRLIEKGYLVLVETGCGQGQSSPISLAPRLARNALENMPGAGTALGYVRKHMGGASCLKTFHGELIRLSANASSLPDRYTVSDALVLPVLIEPRPSAGKLPLVPYRAVKFLEQNCGAMATCLIDALREALKQSGYTGLNAYQHEFIEKYFEERLSNNGPVDGVLAAPTGSGKTIAFTIILLVELFAARCRGDRRKVIVVYPRKTLEREQVESLATIVYWLNNALARRHLGGYSFNILIRDGNSPSTSCGRGVCVEMPRTLASIRGVQVAGAGEARHWFDGTEYHTTIGNKPGLIFDTKEDLIVHGRGTSVSELTDIVVTNYYMLYEAATRNASSQSTHRWFDRMLMDPLLVVMDEAHMLLGSIDTAMIHAYMLETMHHKQAKGGPPERPPIILSSATLLERRVVGPHTQTTSIAGITVSRGPGPRDAGKAVESIALRAPYPLVYVDYYSIAWASTGELKLTLWQVLYPSALRRPLTVLNEALISALHAAAALRGRSGISARTVAFVEYKRTLIHDVAPFLVDRSILDAGDAHDRVLLATKFTRHAKTANIALKLTRRQVVQQQIRNQLIQNYKQAQSLWGAIWQDPFNRFHALAPYFTPHDINATQSRGADPEDLIEDVIARRSAWLSAGRPWLIDLLVQARALKAYSPWTGPSELVNYYQNHSGPHFIVFHHGDYTGNARTLADSLVTRDETLLIVSTSTLEVGLNIPGVVGVFLYILPREPGRALQMVGRSGRTRDTMLTSLGIAVLRHNSWEIPKRLEGEAVRYFLELKTPPSVPLTEDPIRLARLCVTIGDTSCSRYANLINNKNIISDARKLVAERTQTLGLLGGPSANICGDPRSLNSLLNWLEQGCRSLITGDSILNPSSNGGRAMFSILHSGQAPPGLTQLYNSLSQLVIRCANSIREFGAWPELYTLVRALIAILLELSGSSNPSISRLAQDALNSIYFSNNGKPSLYAISVIGAALGEAQAVRKAGKQCEYGDILSKLAFPQPFESPGMRDPSMFSGKVFVR